MWYGQAAKAIISNHRHKALKSCCSGMQWYECWHSEGVAPQFTKPPLFSLEEMGGYYYTIGMLTLVLRQKRLSSTSRMVL